MKKQVHSKQSAVRSLQSTIIAYPVSRITYPVSRITYLLLFLIRNSILLPYSSFLILLLVSCSPSKRLERFLIRHPEFRYPDTLVLRDTITTPLVEADSSFHVERLYDTVVIEKEQLEVSLLRIRDTLYINGKCNPDTIYTETRIPIEKIKLIKPNYLEQFLKNLPWQLFILITLILLLSILKRLL